MAKRDTTGSQPSSTVQAGTGAKAPQNDQIDASVEQRAHNVQVSEAREIGSFEGDTLMPLDEPDQPIDGASEARNVRDPNAPTARPEQESNLRDPVAQRYSQDQTNPAAIDLRFTRAELHEWIAHAGRQGTIEEQLRHTFNRADRQIGERNQSHQRIVITVVR